MGATSPEGTELALYALVCLAAVRAGRLGRVDLLTTDEAVRGLQVLAENEDLGGLLAGDVVARMTAVWARYGPANIAFDPGWARFLRDEHQALSDALSLATATVNYWQLKPSE